MGATPSADERTRLASLSKRERVQELQARIDAVPSRSGTNAAGGTRRIDGVAVPGALGELLPGGGLGRGTVTACPRGALLNALIAAASGAGLATVIIGGTRIGLLSAVELGADLNKIALIPQPGTDPLEIVSVCLEGIPVVVVDLDELTVAPARARVIMGQIRKSGAVVITTNRGWARTELRITTRRVQYIGIGRGRGRLRAAHQVVTVRTRDERTRSGRLVLAGCGGGTQWTQWKPDEAIVPPRLHLAG
ncbi:hypothetical protein [Nocardia suismassiliense]|uniref:hypothetical protein n=1 Tax=Nocardia suismassiliense TaxID=2077092 RepID=UPI000D1E1BD6|nr:hypothetical protein [Nocardia suismassiliense]